MQADADAPRGHRHAPKDCPVCGDRLTLTRLSCETCETELAGWFEPCEFCALDAGDRDLLRQFLLARGNVKELQRHLGVSYPTARARVGGLLVRLGLEAEPDGDEDEPDGDEDERVRLLESLARGEIDVDTAEREL
jgi:hypothetical protein